jgi:hypothetical protein
LSDVGISHDHLKPSITEQIAALAIENGTIAFYSYVKKTFMDGLMVFKLFCNQKGNTYL